MKGWKNLIAPAAVTLTEHHILHMNTTKPISAHHRYLIDGLHWLIIILSLLLITFISIDTFTGKNFLNDSFYMRFQFWVCVIFMADYFIELPLAKDRWKYLKSRFLFFILSIPFLNLIDLFHVSLTPEQLFFVRFVPLARGVLAMTIVVSAFFHNRLTSFLSSYILSLAAFIYLGSLMFFYCESGVNPDVTDFGSALWWACMNATTLGCDIYPVTIPGKILGCALSIGGIVMFPLFTVYITSLIRRYAKTHRAYIVLKSDPGSNDGAATPSAEA